ncbi:hypothetical protein B0H14DRAFT_3438537 [Mycena olivaceomarginata]|nr:hypothetical protein B0H14DRAFT_3438537 [Mycena olivaceomarginata]
MAPAAKSGCKSNSIAPTSVASTHNARSIQMRPGCCALYLKQCPLLGLEALRRQIAAKCACIIRKQEIAAEESPRAPPSTRSEALTHRALTPAGVRVVISDDAHGTSNVRLSTVAANATSVGHVIFLLASLQVLGQTLAPAELHITFAGILSKPESAPQRKTED